MAGITTISWTEKTWNFLRGCSRVSAGCLHCYAEVQANRFKTGAYNGLVKLTNDGPRWTGKIQVVSELLDKPYRWKKPSLIFVNSMSDLFHEQVPVEVIDHAFATMYCADWHIYQILTKRNLRAENYFYSGAIKRIKNLIESTPYYHQTSNSRGKVQWHCQSDYILPPHIWLGFSVEDKTTSYCRINTLNRINASVKWLSVEPLLSRVDLKDQLDDIKWVVVGGESGPQARPCNINWIYRIVEQCRRAKVPVFVKQLGSVYAKDFSDDPLRNYKGERFEEFPYDLKIREYPKEISLLER